MVNHRTAWTIYHAVTTAAIASVTFFLLLGRSLFGILIGLAIGAYVGHAFRRRLPERSS
jgi:hypothetical protein